MIESDVTIFSLATTTYFCVFAGAAYWNHLEQVCPTLSETADAVTEVCKT